MQGDRAKLVLESGKKPHNRLIFLVPALSDAISSMLQYIGLTLITGSTYMMFKGTTIVTTAVFSKILVRMVIEKRHIAGCSLAIMGLVVVGASGLLEKSSDGETKFVNCYLIIVTIICRIYCYAQFSYLQRFPLCF